MRPKRKVETNKERAERQKQAAAANAKAEVAADESVDEMVRRSIARFGA